MMPTRRPPGWIFCPMSGLCLLGGLLGRCRLLGRRLLAAGHARGAISLLRTSPATLEQRRGGVVDDHRDVGRALVDAVGWTTGTRVGALEGRALVGVRGADVELVDAHAVVVLRVGDGALEH